jgi:hypothetical protein
MNYVTTNIRLPEESYSKLKQEAFEKRKSLAAVIRERLGVTNSRSNSDIELFMNELSSTAKKLGKKLKGFDSVKAIREMREKSKW